MIKEIEGKQEGNEYIKLIEKMRELKMNEDHKLNSDELEALMKDFVKEQEDMKIAQSNGVRLVRPPKTVKEVIETLKQADSRFEANKNHLYGGKTPIQEKKKKENAQPLENVPRGISMQRLYYPPSQSEIILVGLKRRAILHSSYIYDLL